MLLRTGLFALTMLAVIGLTFLIWMLRDIPEVHADPEAHFKYGSIGSEARAGIPYWIWMVLPDVFPKHLPEGPGEGYERFGFLYEEQAPRSRPIGTSYREDPIPLVGLNCALCHTGEVRDPGQDEPRVILGMPANQFDLQRYLRFLFAVANDSRFDADILIPAIKNVHPDFGWFEAQFYRLVVIPETRNRLLTEERLFAWMETFPDFGPGRVDTFNPYKFNVFKLEDDDPHVGTSDFPPLWNQAHKEGMWLHWDGNNDSVMERNRSAAIGAGASAESLDTASLDRIADWIAALPPPAFPDGYIDDDLARSGADIFAQNCANCHSFDGELVGAVTDIENIGTDSERLESFNADLSEQMNTLGAGRSWEFSRFRASSGYANMPLDGIWLRAPYLHNGSVPTLRDLLTSPEDRPKEFYRGYPVYDYENVGFVSSGPEAAALGFRFDTKERGNSNEGHLYGIELDDEQIDALIEFLKTR